MGDGDALKKLLFGGAIIKKKVKTKNRLQKLIKKHMDRIIGKGNKYDIVEAVKILHFQDKIMCELLVDTNLGQKYESFSLNFW